MKASQTLLSFLFFVLPLLTAAQIQPEDTQRGEVPRAYLLDEFGRLSECERGARHDIFFAELSKNIGTTGVAIFYNAPDTLPVHFDNPAALTFFAGHARFRRFDISRITVVNGGFRESASTEFWIVPEGAEPPGPTRTIDRPTIPIDHAYLFDRGFIGYSEFGDNDEFVLTQVKAREEAELEALILEESGDTEIEEPWLGEDEEADSRTPEEIEAAQFHWFSEAFGIRLLSKPNYSGTIVFYADYQRYDIARLTAHVDDAVNRFTHENDRIVGRVKIVYGGYRDIPEAEFWIMPENAKEPLLAPGQRDKHADVN